MLTLAELKEYIKDHVEETEFLELLDVTTDQLVEVFEARIEDRMDEIILKLDLEVGNENTYEQDLQEE